MNGKCCLKKDTFLAIYLLLNKIKIKYPLRLKSLVTSSLVILVSPPHHLFVSTGYTGHWGHQFGDGSSECLLCSGTDQHAITKQALLKAVICTGGRRLPTFMHL